MFDVVFWLKAAGSMIGSSIAVVFKPGGDSALKLFQRFVIGTIIGFIASPMFLDYLGWEHSPDRWVAAATLGGLLGYLILQTVFNLKLAQIVNNKLGGGS